MTGVRHLTVRITSNRAEFVVLSVNQGSETASEIVQSTTVLRPTTALPVIGCDLVSHESKPY